MKWAIESARVRTEPAGQPAWERAENLHLVEALQTTAALPPSGSADVDRTLVSAVFLVCASAVLRRSTVEQLAWQDTLADPGCSRRTALAIFTHRERIPFHVFMAVEFVSVAAGRIPGILRRLGLSEAVIDPGDAHRFTLTQGHLLRLAHALNRDRMRRINAMRRTRD